MIRYFPFTEKFDLKMGTSVLPGDQPFIECDEEYMKEVQLKRNLLVQDHAYYFKAAESTIPAQWEVVEKVLTTLAQHYPEHFYLEQDAGRWHWDNKMLNERHEFTYGDSSTLPLMPLDWVGRQIQEDLILLNKESVLVAGQLCFPSGWCLDEKVNRHFLEIHGPLPIVLNPLIQTAGSFIERIPVNKTIVRNNWGFRVSNALDLSSKHTLLYRALLDGVSYQLTQDTIGSTLYLRVEHQTLSRLPVSGNILFTIHTYQSPLEEEAKDASRMRTLSSFLKTVPAELFVYKLMTPFAQSLIDFVDQRHKK
jgi:dimethylamine monooxygenase subunit A